MSKAFLIVKEFERAVADYTGARYAVAVNSCTNALFLCLEYKRHYDPLCSRTVTIPNRTYVSVPMQIMHAYFKVAFRDEVWLGKYELEPLDIWDSARLFTSDMYLPGSMMCTSHHWSKTLGIQQGGCILHDNPHADEWFRRARFDGRAEGVPPKNDDFPMLGWHCYMSPEVAAEGLVRLHFLPKHNAPLPNDDYPDLSKFEIFRLWENRRHVAAADRHYVTAVSTGRYLPPDKAKGPELSPTGPIVLKTEGSITQST